MNHTRAIQRTQLRNCICVKNKNKITRKSSHKQKVRKKRSILAVFPDYPVFYQVFQISLEMQSVPINFPATNANKIIFRLKAPVSREGARIYKDMAFFDGARLPIKGIVHATQITKTEVIVLIRFFLRYPPFAAMMDFRVSQFYRRRVSRNHSQ